MPDGLGVAFFCLPKLTYVVIMSARFIRGVLYKPLGRQCGSACSSPLVWHKMTVWAFRRAGWTHGTVYGLPATQLIRGNYICRAREI